MENKKPIHRIRIQRVEVEFEKPDNVFEIKAVLSDVCSRGLIPAIQQLFDEKYADCPPLCIPFLEINAGRLNADRWETDLVKTVIRRLECYLDVENAGRQLQNGLTGKGDVADQERASNASFILYYLKNGVFPWNSPFEQNEQLRRELLRLLKTTERRRAGKGATGFHRIFIRDLLGLLAANFNAMKRFLYLVPENKLLPFIVKREWDRRELRKMRANWNAIFGLAGLPEEDRDLVFLYALNILHGKESGQAQSLPDMLSQEIVRVLEQRYKPVFQQLPEVLEKYLILLPETPPFRYRQGPPDFPTPETSRMGLTEEPLYIANAGLVLLHAFLHNLFENTGHTINNKWDSRDLQQRSIILSQYLVSGQDHYTEHDLFLNKLMSGFPPDAPLPLEIGLSDFEKNEARELLESVIGRWQVLRDTGIEGLREGFLQRPGKIIHRQNGWMLEVGQRVSDTLLSKIPWDFSRIKTPWMKEVLKVEWT